MNLPKKLRTLTPYAPENGAFSVRMNANESPDSLPPQAQDKLAARLAALSLNRYPDPTAAALRAAFSERFSTDADCVLAGNGSDELILLMMSAFLCEGDKVLLCTPDFEMYAFYARAQCASILTLDKDDRGVIDTAALTALCAKEKPALVFLSNPCNPTGLALERAALLSVIEQSEATFVIDEAYMDFYDEQQSLIPDAQKNARIIVLRTLSKAYALAAARIGFAVSHPTLIAALAAFKSPYNVNALSQAAGEVVLRDADSYLARLSRIRAERDRMYAALSALAPRLGFSVQESCANFFLLRFSDAHTAARAADALSQAGICVRRFPAALRITVSDKADNDACLALLATLSR